MDEIFDLCYELILNKNESDKTYIVIKLKCLYEHYKEIKKQILRNYRNNKDYNDSMVIDLLLKRIPNYNNNMEYITDISTSILCSSPNVEDIFKKYF